MFTILFFLLLVGVSLFFISNLYKKISFQKQQIVYLSRQNDSLRSKIEKNVINIDFPSIRYVEISKTKAATKNTGHIYLAPVSSLPITWSVEKDTILDILDCAKIQNIQWYEVCYLYNESVKIKGWIPASELVLLNDTLK